MCGCRLGRSDYFIMGGRMGAISPCSSATKAESPRVSSETFDPLRIHATRTPLLRDERQLNSFFSRILVSAAPDLPFAESGKSRDVAMSQARCRTRIHPSTHESVEPAANRSTRAEFSADAGRGGEIRTPDPLFPKQVRYQTALRPDSIASLPQRNSPWQISCA